MISELEKAMDRLSPTQREAVLWGDGSALVLAGPGVGKTTVLTFRIARILAESPKRNFRVLALTFTTKAGDVMRGRVEQLVPNLTHRTVIGTFHSFCAQVLRQHGSHLGVKPDFAIYDQDSDREELLREALVAASLNGELVSSDHVRWLAVIDRLRSRLVGPRKIARHFSDIKTGKTVERVYEIYEAALRDLNAMDFNGLILDTCRLAHDVPAVAARIRGSYPYWLIDEFQDTSPAQYRLIRFLAGDDFRNVFAVADDDQIIYQWAGASYRQIAAFREHFSPQLFQLVENRRCPPEVVSAANNLVVHNSDRTPGRKPLIATLQAEGPAIHIRTFDSDTDEAAGVAAHLTQASAEERSSTVVLGRTRAVLQPVLDALLGADVKAAIINRRDRFVSPQFVWLQSCLDQAVRPMDRRVSTLLVDAANRIANLDLDADLLVAEAEAEGFTALEHWARAVHELGNETGSRLGQLAMRLVESRVDWRQVVKEAVEWLPTTAGASYGLVSDASEDQAAWRTASRAIRSDRGEVSLSEFLQELVLRPKEPPTDPQAVCLSTIHAAKGLEFNNVWIVALVESILPSWQSLKAEAPAEMLEEERRNCFVAITRTQRRLTLSWAKWYGRWQKKRSRFVDEMGLES